MFAKKNLPAETLPEDRVQLKPLFGIRPGVYLAILYGLVLGIILFFVLLYPGLTNPGTALALTSEPSGAAVRVDDVYMGTTPCKVFIPRGNRRLELILPGFVPYQKNLAIQGHLLDSTVFSQKKPFHETLEESALGAALLWGAEDYAVWSFAGEPTPIYQIPQRLSEGAYRSGAKASDPQQHQTLEQILQGAARFTSTKAGLRDLIRAKYGIDNGGLASSPVSIIRSLEDILEYLSKTPETARWLKELLPTETAALLTNSAWYAGVPQPDSKPESSGFGETLSLGLLTFREISGKPFSIAETEVSYSSWEAFIKANPEWGPEYTETLTAQGLVTGDYLAGNLDYDAVSGVSWYAAQAYCQWLTGLLPAGLSADYTVRLPTEAEWEYAAEHFAKNGRLWEWCEDLYAPNNFLPADQRIITAIGSPERTVRGVLTRGSLFPASCSPFGSFRPVIVKKEAAP